MTMLSSNAKFGGKSFNVLPQDTCFLAGIANALCKGACYVPHMYVDRPLVYRRMKNNHPQTQRVNFAYRMICEIERSGEGDIRLYSGGDFGNVQILNQWIEICRETPQVKYLDFTRAWVEERFIPGLTTLATLPNVNLWMSVDALTGKPPTGLLPNTKTVWLARHDEENPPYKVDLVWRATAERDSKLYNGDHGNLKIKNRLPILKTMAGYPVCKKETGAPKMPRSCITCRFCMFKTG